LKLAISSCPDVPFIFVTGTLGEEVAIEALKVGATDYVLKTSLSRLAPSIRRALREADERSERKRAEKALRRNEAYLAEAQTLSHTGSFGWDVPSGEIYWSEETFKVFGYEPGVRPNLQLIFQRTHPDDRDHVEQTINCAIAAKQHFDLEHRLLMPDGSIKYLRVLSRAIETSPGNLEFVGAVTDVTAAKQAEEKIRQDEMELRQMLDLAPQIVGVFGPGGERLYANRVGLDFVGRSLEEWRQTPGNFFQAFAFFHPDDQDRAALAYSDSVRAGGSAYEMESRLRKRDGTGTNYALVCCLDRYRGSQAGRAAAAERKYCAS
jgi:PAS domain S-box-containing protein